MKLFTSVPACFLAVAAPASAQPAPEPAAAGAHQPSAKAYALADLVMPAELSLASEMTLAKQGFDAGLKTEEAQQLEVDYPGIYKAVWEAIEPEFRRAAVANHPRHRERVARLYSSRLSPEELDAMQAFFSGPTGQKLISAMYQHIDIGPVVAEVEQGASRISPQALAAAQDAAKRKAAQQMTAEDERALLAFGQSVPLAKMQAVAAEVQVLLQEFVNEQDADFDARVDALITATVERYMESPAPAQ